MGLTICSKTDESQNQTDVQPKKYERLILNKQIIIKKIGQGSFGCVYYCKIKGTDNEVAIKTVKIKDAQRNNMKLEDILNECQILNEIKSPHVMKLIDHRCENEMLYLICEQINGKELLTAIETLGFVSESIAKSWFYKILLGVHHIHLAKIIHRDLKLENIFLKFKKQGNAEVIDDVKIVDFGFGIKSDKNTKGLMGTPNQMPPEALKKLPYNNKFDMWSLGIILYVILVGDFPFEGRDLNNLYKNIKTQPINQDIRELSNVSETCKDLLNKLLEKDSTLRLSSEEALKHDWFKDAHNNIDELVDFNNSKNVVSNLKNYKQGSKLNKAIKMFNQKLSRGNKDVNKLRDLFLASDDNNNGSLEKNEFRNCMHKLYNEITDDEADDFFEMLDVNQDGNINQDEFISALLDSNKINVEMNVEYIQQQIDKDNNGTITIEEIKMFLNENDVSYLDMDVKEIMGELDKNNDGVITADEFKSSFSKLIDKLS